jgi:hypothetical protein
MTEVNLSRQDEGEERFGSTALSRNIVSFSLGINNYISGILPEKTKDWMSERFAPLPRKKKEKNQPAFDLLRASVNLVVSSALIAFGTSLKLPLSTTYVTFMVAMGTSLSDGAWDRESAVYRITGVFSVIGGWFFTAISAFTLSFILATLFYFGGTIAIFAMISVAVFMAYRSHRIHLKKEETSIVTKTKEEAVNPENLNEFCVKNAEVVFTKASTFYFQIIAANKKADIVALRNVKKDIAALQKEARMQRKIVSQLLKGPVEQEADQAYYAIRTQDNILEILNCFGIIANASFNHLSNYHKPLNENQLAELKAINAKIILFLYEITRVVVSDDKITDGNPELLKINVEAEIELSSKNEVKRIREEMTGNRNSILFMSMLQETRNIVYFSGQVIQNLIK